MSTTTPAFSWKKEDLLEVIAQRIEQQERLESELGPDLQRTLGLPDVADLKRGLEILRQEHARHASQQGR